MNKKTSIYLIILCFLMLTQNVQAQKTATVSGKYTYVITENDDVTLNEAKRKCIELAKAAAIREEFGEMITSDVIDSNTVRKPVPISGRIPWLWPEVNGLEI